MAAIEGGGVRKPLVWIVVAAIVAGVGAYLFYFGWTQPLLESDRIVSYAYGRQSTNQLELERHGRDAGSTLEQLLTLLNRAEVTAGEVERDPNDLVVILYRDDDLQYRVYLDGPRADGTYAVGVSEGDEGYLGSLQEPGLVEVLKGLAARLPE